MGAYRDDKGEAVVVIPMSGSSSFTKEQALALGIPVRIEFSPVELSDISEIQQSVSKVDWIPTQPLRFGPSAAFVPSLGIVEIVSDAPREKFAAILDDFAGKVRFDQRALRATSRMNDWEPHYGGASMVRPASAFPVDCTSGFSVLTSTGKQRMVTAGHCWWPYADPKVDSPQGQLFGHIKNRTHFYDNPGVDALLVGDTGISMAPYIYTGGATGTPFGVWTSASTNSLSTDLCFSGAGLYDGPGTPSYGQYENCGLRYWSGPYTSNLFLGWDDNGVPGWQSIGQMYRWYGTPGHGSCPSDSGAPFYRYIHPPEISEFVVTANGIVSGGNDDVANGNHWNGDQDYGPCLDDEQTDVLVQYMPRILSAYDLTLKTVQ